MRSVRKLSYGTFILALAAATASAQSGGTSGSSAQQPEPKGPPAFVTLPRHAGIEDRTTDSSHPVPFRLELRNEMFEMVGGFAPGGGGSGGGKRGAVGQTLAKTALWL